MVKNASRFGLIDPSTAAIRAHVERIAPPACGARLILGLLAIVL